MERAGIRAYVPLTGAGKARPYFSKEEFAYDLKQDLYRCPAGQTLRRFSEHAARKLTKYRADGATCAACSLRPECTTSKRGREVLRYHDEDYVDRVRSYFGTFAYEKALRKRRVWLEPLFAEAKDWHGLRRFRLRRLEKMNIEALLIASGQNIKRLVAARGRSPRKPAQVAALRRPDPVSRCRPHLSDRRPLRLPNSSVFQHAGKLRRATRPGEELGPGLFGQLQPGMGGACRRAQAAHWRRVQEGQRGGTELIRAALAGLALGGIMGRREDLAGRSPGMPLPFTPRT